MFILDQSYSYNLSIIVIYFCFYLGRIIFGMAIEWCEGQFLLLLFSPPATILMARGKKKWRSTSHCLIVTKWVRRALLVTSIEPYERETHSYNVSNVISCVNLKFKKGNHWVFIFFFFFSRRFHKIHIIACLRINILR